MKILSLFKVLLGIGLFATLCGASAQARTMVVRKTVCVKKAHQPKRCSTTTTRVVEHKRVHRHHVRHHHRHPHVRHRHCHRHRCYR